MLTLEATDCSTTTKSKLVDEDVGARAQLVEQHDDRGNVPGSPFPTSGYLL